MALNQDFKEFIQSLNDNRVRYLVVGGYAVIAQAIPRRRDPRNAMSVVPPPGDFGKQAFCVGIVEAVPAAMD